MYNILKGVQMAYLALYRKYRPVDFNDFAGQDDITESLRYQVKTETFGHSYLFNGIRGTGKTSMAKVFAKAVNCLEPDEGNPCNRCSSCEAFNQNAMLDVIEIDAASNNGVDDIRELRENSHFLPSSSKYKVYIIDEVQMLSQGAFNALLKTLEEPSKRVIFILATTELHKIPDTILSRCQRYSFRRIDESDMVERLSLISEREDITYDKSALRLITEHAGGSMRDAISLMDKTLALTRSVLTEESVAGALGLLGRDRTHQMMSHMLQGDVGELLLAIDEVLLEGKEVSVILEEMISFLRGILMTKLVRREEIVSRIVSFSTARFKESYEDVDRDVLEEILEVLVETLRGLRYARLPRLSLEMALIKGVHLSRGFEKKEVKRIIEKRQIETVEEYVKPQEIQDKDLQGYWDNVLEYIKEHRHASLYDLLVEGSITQPRDFFLELHYLPDQEFFVSRIRQPKNKGIIREALNEVLGEQWLINVLIKEPDEQPEVKDEASLEERLKAFAGDKLTIKE